jgi:hypothetical protein
VTPPPSPSEGKFLSRRFTYQLSKYERASKIPHRRICLKLAWSRKGTSQFGKTDENESHGEFFSVFYISITAEVNTLYPIF